MSLPAFLSGTIGVFCGQAIGVHPAPHLMPAARGVEHNRQRAECGHFLAFQGGAQLQRFSRRVVQDHTKRIKPYDERSPLLECRTHAWHSA